MAFLMAAQIVPCRASEDVQTIWLTGTGTNVSWHLNNLPLSADQMVAKLREFQRVMLAHGLSPSSEVFVVWSEPAVPIGEVLAVREALLAAGMTNIEYRVGDLRLTVSPSAPPARKYKVELKIGNANHTSNGIRQPADGSPQPSR